MAAGPSSYGMTDTMGRMHSDAQFAGSSSVPAHVEMMGLIGMGNNPMVGATVAVAYLPVLCYIPGAEVCNLLIERIIVISPKSASGSRRRDYMKKPGRKTEHLISADQKGME